MKEVSLMNKTKSTVFWIIYSAVSFTALIVAFPTLLFCFYPYSIIAVALYVATVLILRRHSRILINGAGPPLQGYLNNKNIAEMS